MKKVVWGCAVLMFLITLCSMMGLAQGKDPMFNQTGPTTCEVGCTGPAGPQGPAGINGINGRDGAAGRDGVDGRNGRDGRDGIDLTIRPAELTPLVHWDGAVPGYQLMGTIVNETNLNDVLLYSPKTGEMIIVRHYSDSLWLERRPPSEGELLHPGGSPRKVWTKIVAMTKDRHTPLVLFAMNELTGDFCFIPWRGYGMLQVY